MRIVVIGGGIAGVAATYGILTHPERPASLELTLVEAEAELAHHTTGRSAAQFIMNYGTADARALTRASRPTFTDPPSDLIDHPLLRPRGVLTLARAGQDSDFETALAEGQSVDPSICEISLEEASDLFPVLRPGRFERASVEPNSCDIDVAALHQMFVRGIRSAGVPIRMSHRVDSLKADGEGWRVETANGSIGADFVVNAAGAWGDVVARSADIAPVGLQPMRRTAFMVANPGPRGESWPLTAPVDHPWYVKPDGAQLLCSPANEDPMEPCDVKPEELDIAAAIDRINADTTLDIRSVRSAWAGQRTFAPDRSMVIGPEPGRESFVWMVGQGGTGIQTAPAAGELVADLILCQRPRRHLDECLALHDLGHEALGPGRFR